MHNSIKFYSCRLPVGIFFAETEISKPYTISGKYGSCIIMYFKTFGVFPFTLNLTLNQILLQKWINALQWKKQLTPCWK